MHIYIFEFIINRPNSYPCTNQRSNLSIFMKVDEHSEEQPTDETSTTAATSGVYPVTPATSGV